MTLRADPGRSRVEAGRENCGRFEAIDGGPPLTARPCEASVVLWTGRALAGGQDRRSAFACVNPKTYSPTLGDKTSSLTNVTPATAQNPKRAAFVSAKPPCVT